MDWNILATAKRGYESMETSRVRDFFLWRGEDLSDFLETLEALKEIADFIFDTLEKAGQQARLSFQDPDEILSMETVGNWAGVNVDGLAFCARGVNPIGGLKSDPGSIPLECRIFCPLDSEDL